MEKPYRVHYSSKFHGVVGAGLQRLSVGGKIDRLTRSYKLILIFYRPVGAGSPKYLTPIDKLSKPAPTPPTNRSQYFRAQRDRP
ncbi:hypothetical protein BCD67_22510 [Oscillatoriales cyanobacterium USR001]|nr:hypothetical protein BCD67_22510 [Oscillatoriales cyanobacterium USR001]